MIKGLRLAFGEELRGFGRGCRVQELFRNTGIYTCKKSKINKITPKKIPKNQTIIKRKVLNLKEFRT